MRTLLFYTSLLVLVAILISCQKNDDVSFESIYSNNDINKIVIIDKNEKMKEITDTEMINEWLDQVRQMTFIRDENQEERDFLLTYDGCFVKVFHQDKEIGDFKQLKLKGVYYKENIEFDKQVELLCQLEI